MLGAQAQNHATNVNADNARRTNELNRQMFEQARGSKGNAIMPWYLKTPSGESFESATVGPELMKVFNQTGSATPEDFRALLARLSPAQTGAENTTNDIFSGGITEKLLSNQAPVGRARVAATREASINALNDTLGKIEAAQASKGFTGDSFGNRLLRYKAMRDSSAATAGANLQNEMEQKAIRDYGQVQLPLSSLQLPYAMQQQMANTFTLPDSAYLDMLGKRLAPLNFLNIHTSAPFQYSPMPTVGAQTSPWQLLAQGGAATGNAVLDAYLKRSLAKQYAGNDPSGGLGNAAAVDLNPGGAVTSTNLGSEAASGAATNAAVEGMTDEELYALFGGG